MHHDIKTLFNNLIDSLYFEDHVFQVYSASYLEENNISWYHSHFDTHFIRVIVTAYFIINIYYYDYLVNMNMSVKYRYNHGLIKLQLHDLGFYSINITLLYIKGVQEKGISQLVLCFVRRQNERSFVAFTLTWVRKKSQ